MLWRRSTIGVWERSDLRGLQIDQNKALEDIVVEDKVDVVVFLLCMNVLLPGDEGIALAQLHQKIAHIVENRRLQIVLGE